MLGIQRIRAAWQRHHDELAGSCAGGRVRPEPSRSPPATVIRVRCCVTAPCVVGEAIAPGRWGNGTNTGSSVPVPVAGLSGATAVTAGYGHSCALLQGGSARCWGFNLSGQFGKAPATDSWLPVPVFGLSSIAEPLSAETFVPLTPSRILNTRSGAKVGNAAGTGAPLLVLKVTGQGGVPATGVAAVALNVTVTQSENPAIGGGYVTVYPCDKPRPDASNLNFVTDQTVPNLGDRVGVRQRRGLLLRVRDRTP